MKIELGDSVSGLPSGAVPGEEQFSGEAAPHLPGCEAATNHDLKEGRHENQILPFRAEFV